VTTPSEGSTDIGRPQLALVRLAIGAGILGVLVVWMGVAPFRSALSSVTVGSLAFAVAVTAVTTLCAAWRWRIVAERLGIKLPLPAAVAAYYRSQFLNATLPGGVLGDVHRGVRHGRDVGAVGRGLRTVGWDRALGQSVQATLTALVLLVLPLPAPTAVLLIAAVTATVAAVVALLLWIGRRRARGALPRAVSTVADDVRLLMGAPGPATGIVVASTGVVVGHAAIFVIAARASGVTASLDQLLPIALTVLLVSAVPTSIAGWGPREGAAAWAFAAAGLGGAQGLTTAVVFGVLSLAATLPGAVVLLVGGPRRLGPPDEPEAPTPELAQVSHG
jgi:glycosyltransferase 2 family protein